MSGRKSQSRFEWCAIRKQYFDICIDLYNLTWQKMTFQLGSNLIMIWQKYKIDVMSCHRFVMTSFELWIPIKCLLFSAGLVEKKNIRQIQTKSITYLCQRHLAKSICQLILLELKFLNSKLGTIQTLCRNPFNNNTAIQQLCNRFLKKLHTLRTNYNSGLLFTQQ